MQDFTTTSLFLGQVVDESGIKADPNKIAAICNVPVPSNVGDIRRFLGTANKMSKFAPNLAEVANEANSRPADQREPVDVRRSATTSV